MGLWVKMGNSSFTKKKNCVKSLTRNKCHPNNLQFTLENEALHTYVTLLVS